MINDINKIKARLGGDLKSLTKMLDATLATVPKEGMDQMAEVRGDMQKVINSIKKGDSGVSEQIIKKYANSQR